MIDTCEKIADKILEPVILNVLGSGRIIKMCKNLEKGLGCPFSARYCLIKHDQESESLLHKLGNNNESGFWKLSDIEAVYQTLWDENGQMVMRRYREGKP